jgi:hypothetical protein
MPPSAVAYLIRLGFVTAMNSAAFISKGDRAKLISKGRDSDAIVAARAKAWFDNILAGTVSSGRKTFKKLTPEERATRLASKLSPEDRASLLATLTSDEGASDDDDSKDSKVVSLAAI